MMMFDRREFLLVAISGLAQCAICRGAHATFEGQLGCCILPNSGGDFAISYGNQPQQEPTIDDFLATMTTQSGLGKDFERDLGRVLSGLSKLFHVTPGFGFYDDSISKNAFAINKRKILGTKGTVAFGHQLLSEQMAIDENGISMAAICAHEFGHIYQYTSGFYDRITESLPSYCVELHADYLAGIFLRYFKDERPNVNVETAGIAWEEMGSADFINPGSHGTQKQRLSSIEQGFKDAADHISVDKGARLGLKFVSRYSTLQ